MALRSALSGANPAWKAFAIVNAHISALVSVLVRVWQTNGMNRLPSTTRGQSTSACLAPLWL
eukprot:398867-Pyramimonas_sp.AAC.1